MRWIKKIDSYQYDTDSIFRLANGCVTDNVVGAKVKACDVHQFNALDGLRISSGAMLTLDACGSSLAGSSSV